MAEPYDSQVKQANTAGKPQPLDFRKARQVEGLVDGTDLDSGVHLQVLTPIAGALLVRVRGKLTCNATLSFKYHRSPPNAGTAYSAAVKGAHDDVAIVANTEFFADVGPGGEALLELDLLPGADGVVTFFDVMQQ